MKQSPRGLSRIIAGAFHRASRWVIYTATLLLSGFSSGAFAQGQPFLCNETLYFDDVPFPPALYMWNRSSQPFTSIHLFDTGSLPGLSFNPADGYLYAIYADGRLQRIGSGGVQDLGAISVEGGLISWSGAADFDTSGNYHLVRPRAAVETSAYLFTIDVSTRTGVRVPLSQEIPVTDDGAWYNNRLYFIAGSPDTLFAVDLSGTVEEIGPIGLPPGFYALYGGVDGVYGFADPQGSLYRFDTTNGSATPVVALNSSAVDVDGWKYGASCPTAVLFSLAADLAVTMTSDAGGYVPGQPVEYSITVRNQGPSDVQNAEMNNPLPPGLSNASWTCTPDLRGTSGDATCAAPNGSGSITGARVSLPSGSSAVFTLTATVQAGFSGNLTNNVTIAAPAGVQDTNTANNSATLTLQQQQAQPPFSSCASTMYVSGSSTSDAPTGLYELDDSMNPFALDLLGEGTITYSAPGFNPVDNYIYAVQHINQVGSNLVRVGSNGVPQVLGAITGLPVLFPPSSGTINPEDGMLYTARAGTPIYRVDLATRAVVSQIPNTANLIHLAWHDGFLYASGYNGSVYALFEIDPTTGAIRDVGPTGHGTHMGAMFGASNGVFGISQEYLVNGFYQFDTQTGFATRIATGDSPQYLLPGGIKCPTSPLNFSTDLAVEKTSPSQYYEPGQDVVYTIHVQNNGQFGAQRVLVSDILPAGLGDDAQWICEHETGAADPEAGTCVVTGGTGQLTDVPVNLPPGSHVTFTLTVPVPASFTGALTNTATVTSPDGWTDPVPANNEASVTLQSSVAVPFPACDRTMYVSNVVYPTGLYEWDDTTDPWTTSYAGDLGSSFALAFNPADRYIYGIYNTGILVRVGSDGVRREIGPVSGLTVPTYNMVGDIDPDGNYYVMSVPPWESAVFRIDLATMTAQRMPSLSQTGHRPDDLAWHNGLLYFIDSQNSPDVLHALDPVTGTVSQIGPTGLPTITGGFVLYGAAEGVYGYADPAGELYRFDPLTGQATPVADLNGAVNFPHQNGASCASASLFASETDLAITKDDGQTAYTPGGTVNYDIIVSNNGPVAVTGVQISDPLPSGISSASWTCGGETGGAACGASGGTGGISTTADLPAGSSVTYTLSMAVPIGFGGDLTNIASVIPPAGIIDSDPANNTASDTNTQFIFPPDPGGNTCNLANNGSFESPNIQTAPEGADEVTSYVNGYAVWRTSTAPIDGWQIVSGTVDRLRHFNNASEGMQSIDLFGTAPAAVRQTFTGLVPGQQYTFSIDYSGLSSADSTAMIQLGNGAGSTPITIATLAPAADAIANGDAGIPNTPQYSVTWSTYRYTFVAAGTEATIQVVNSVAAGPFSTGLFIDNFVFASNAPCDADLEIEKTNGSQTYIPGTDVTYTIIVRNNGPAAVQDALVTDALPAGITEASWTCEPDPEGLPGVCASSSGTGSIFDAEVDLPAGASVMFTMTVLVPEDFTGPLENQATVTLPGGLTDPNPDNNTDRVTLFPRQPAFACDATLYWSHSNFLRVMNISTNPPTVAVNNSYPFGITALGFNPQDGYLYALQSSSNVLVRFGSDWSAQELGPVDGLPQAHYEGGEFDPDGNYYVRSGTAPVLYRIDVAGPRAEPISLTSSNGRTLYTSYDLAWHDGLLYFLDGSGSSNTNNFRAINPDTGEVTDLGPTSLGDSGAAWGDPNNAFIGNASVYTGSTTEGFVRWITAWWEDNNSIFPAVDGAKCPTAAIEFPADLVVEKTTTQTSYVPGGEVVYTMTVTNNGPFGVHNARLTDLLPAGTTQASWTCQPLLAASNMGKCGGRSFAGTGTGAIEDVPLQLYAGNSVTFTFTVEVPQDFTGDLVNTAQVELPAGSPDPNEVNNESTVILKPLPRLTIAKVTEGGVGSFTFNGSAANANGFPTDSTYVVVTENEGQARQGPTLPLSAFGVATEIVEDVPTGWTLSQARCEDLNAATTGNPPGMQIGSLSDFRTLVIPAENVKSGANLVCTFTNSLEGRTLSGRVIIDNGAGSGTAHDGALNGGEVGIGGIKVQLTDCAATVHHETMTNADGDFVLPLGPSLSGPVCVERAAVTGHIGISGSAGDTGGSIADPYDRFQFTVLPGTDYSGVVFGMIALPGFAIDNSVTVAAGGSVPLFHKYTASTSGVVSFALANEIAEPGPSAFSMTLYEDGDCSGALEAAEKPLTVMIGVEAGEEICLIVLVQATAGAPVGSKLAYDLVATTALSSLSKTLTATNHDIVTVSGNGTITLVKRVRNVTTGGEDGPLAASSSGSPGDVLEYVINFTNPSASAVNDVSIYDATPAYTSLVEPILVRKAPPGMNCEVAVPSGSVPEGYAGGLRWNCAGTMLAGSEGEVSFRVRITE